MRVIFIAPLTFVMSLTACSSTQTSDITIAALSKKELDLEQPVAISLKRENTSGFYRSFLNNAPKNSLYGDALRRLADIELQTGQEKGASDNKKDQAQSKHNIKTAIHLYETFLKEYPGRSNNDLILYQLAKAYELDLQKEKMLNTLNTIVSDYPESRYIEEVQFRRGEAYFVQGQYQQAQQAYYSIVTKPAKSDYYEKALYKYGWARFKQSAYTDTSRVFVQFLDRKYQQGQLLNDGPSDKMSRSERELLVDVLRVTSLSFSYQQGHQSITNYFAENGHKPFESILYNNLAELYLEKDRIRDASETYLAYSKTYPTSSLAPRYHSKAIETYKKGGFASLVLPAKISFVNQYGVNTKYWKLQDLTARESITPLLKQHIQELANHFHAEARDARKSKNKTKQQENASHFTASITQATTWYKTYITSFPEDKGTEQINFLLAEAHQDAGQYRNAIFQFEKTAYQYPKHNKQESAAYAALLLYPAIEKSLSGEQQKQWQNKKINSALKFSEHFPENKKTPPILANTAEELFKIGDYPRAINTATKLSLNTKPTTSQGKTLLINALLVIGHSEFEMKQYEKAESTYQKLRTHLPRNHKEYNNINDRLAASIYKQGEKAKLANKNEEAAEFFLRVGKVVPTSNLRANAEYDAASIYISLEKWDKAQKILEHFRKDFPASHPLQFGVSEKLALVYNKTGKALKAADEMIVLSRDTKHYAPEQRRQLLWEAATIYNANNRKKTAQKILEDYVHNFPSPLEPAIEARQMLAEFNKDNKQHYYWLREIIKADNAGGKQRTQRTQYLAANAYMKLTLPLFKAYTSARLTIPLQRSLKKKKHLMEKVVKSYDNAMKYRVAEITTAATFYIAEIYNDFATSLLQSQRPKNLKADELEQYTVLIEEQAFPFEEKAIDIHTANADRVKDNIYDEWVKKSISRLSKLNPVRYAKTELREDYVE